MFVPRCSYSLRTPALTVLLLALAGCQSQPTSVEPRGESLYVTMTDGTRIAIDVWLPTDLAEGATLPTVMHMTRYWRGTGMVNYDPVQDSEAQMADQVNAAGYILISVDARGTGASFGVYEGPWSPKEVSDYGEVVDWIIAQSWSNGRVGAFGVSYDGNTSLLLGSQEHPAVKAVVPQFYDVDPYRSPGRPGGLLAQAFVRSWSDMTWAMDQNDLCWMAEQSGVPCALIQQLLTGPKPVDEDVDGSLVEAAVAEHAANLEVYPALESAVFADDAFGEYVSSLSSVSPYTYLPALERSGTALHSWASWLDAGTATGALSVYMSTTNPHKVVIGAWSHGALFDADPFAPVDRAVSPTMAEQYAEIFTFLDGYLKGDEAPDPVREIRYYTLNAGTWQTTDTWPPAGSTPQSWYFAADNQLVTELPAAGSGADEYTVDFTTTAGGTNRWATQNGGGDVIYGDRAAADALLLTYTSVPLSADLRVVGDPIITLHVASTTADGAYYAYLEDVDSNGVVTYVTEGELRALHHQISSTTPPYVQFGPYHSFLRADGAEPAPGEVTEITFALQPTAVLFEAGHRIRVALAGHDADMFERVPAEGTPQWTVHRNAASASRIVLPVLP